MIKPSSTHNALLLAVLLAACDANSDAAGKHLKSGDEANVGKSRDDTARVSDDEEVSGGELGQAAGTQADGDAPAQEPGPPATLDPAASAASGGATTTVQGGGASTSDSGSKSPGDSSGEPGNAPTPGDSSGTGGGSTATEAPQWFVKGSVSPAFGAGPTQHAALEAGAKVRLSSLLDTGATQVLADADVAVDGKFGLKLPVAVGIKLGVAELLDLSGHVIGSVMVGKGAVQAGDVLDLPPITAETSLEAQVLLAASRCPCPAQTKPTGLSLALDISALIDANLSTSLAAALKLGASLDLVTQGLADAVVSAARARAEVLADGGVSLDGKVLLDAQLKALIALEQSLCAVAGGQQKLTDVVAKLALDLDGSVALAGNVAADLRVRAHVAASLAFSSSLAAAFKADAKLNASIFAAVHSATSLEAEVTADAVVELLKATGASSADVQVAVKAGLDLKAAVAVAVNVQALVDARTKFIETVCGKPSSSGGLLGGVLGGVTGLVGGLLDGVLGAVLNMSVNLDAQLALDLRAIANVDVCASADASVGLDAGLAALADTLAKFAGEVQASAARASASASATAAARVLVTAQLLARASI